MNAENIDSINNRVQHYGVSGRTKPLALMCLTQSDTFLMFFRSPRYAQVVWVPPFERTVSGVLDDEEMRILENRLVQDPRLGVVLPGTGGA